jgi:hypothetical protein
MAKTRRTPRPETAKPLVKTKPAPVKTSKTANTSTIATTGINVMKKGGHHPDDEAFYDRLGNLCKYRGLHGTVRVSRSEAELGNWVHYIRKRKAQGVLPAHHVDALHGLEFEWKTQVDRKQFEDWVAQLKEYK